jgi:hypothetical protein
MHPSLETLPEAPPTGRKSPSSRTGKIVPKPIKPAPQGGTKTGGSGKGGGGKK